MLQRARLPKTSPGRDGGATRAREGGRGNAAAQEALGTGGVDPVIQAVLDAHQAKGGLLFPHHMAALQELRGNKSGDWKHLDWASVKRGAAERIFDPGLIRQRNMNACGPSVVVHSIAASNPIRYAQLVVEVFTKATFNGKKLDVGLVRNDPGPTGCDPADWMMLAGLRNKDSSPGSFFGLFQFYGNPADGDGPTDSATGMTADHETGAWMKELIGAKEVVRYRGAAGVESVNTLMKENAGKVAVLLLVRDLGLGHDHADGTEGSVFPDHWIKLLRPVETVQIPCGDPPRNTPHHRLAVFDPNVGGETSYDIPTKETSRTVEMLQAISLADGVRFPKAGRS